MGVWVDVVLLKKRKDFDCDLTYEAACLGGGQILGSKAIPCWRAEIGG